MVLGCTVDALYAVRKKDTGNCAIFYLGGILKDNVYRANPCSEDSLKESMQRCAIMVWLLIKLYAVMVCF
jgi:hypothetical protein